MISLYIEENEIEKIFIENYKGKNAEEAEGSGIGMFLVKRALKIMGGDIKVATQPNTEIMMNGSKYAKNTFLIYLPLK